MSSNLVLWDPYKAGQVGNLKGQMTGYVAGLYSVPGMANIAAAPTEVLNQNGYNIYQILILVIMNFNMITILQ